MQRPVTGVSCFTNWKQTSANIKIETCDESSDSSGHPMFYLEIENLNVEDLRKLRNQINVAISELS